MRVLTAGKANAKTAKNDSDNYISAILHLAPAKLSGYNVCSAASNGCKAACLNTAGRGAFNFTQLARINKTKRFFEQKAEFMSDLVKDIKAIERKAKKENKKAAVRLNGTSDLDWTNVINMFPNVQFYDYTKRVVHMCNYIDGAYPPNYHLTFSMSECNEAVSKRILDKGGNVAVVFAKSIPESYQGFNVVSGDNTDLRFNDNVKGTIIGLLAKGKAKKDTTGFVKVV